MTIESQPWKIRIEEDPRLRVVLSGEIDMAATAELFTCLQAAERRTPGRVSIDLGGVTFLDSAGIGIFARLVAAGVVLDLSNATGIAERALKIAGLLP